MSHTETLLNQALNALILLENEMVLSGNAGSTDYGWKPAITKTREAIAALRRHMTGEVQELAKVPPLGTAMDQVMFDDAALKWPLLFT